MKCVTHGGTCAFQFPDCRPAMRPARSFADFCTWQAPAGRRIGDPCPECGHSDVVHVGTDHCPVCELVYQATPQFRRQQERIHGGRRLIAREW